MLNPSSQSFKSLLICSLLNYIQDHWTSVHAPVANFNGPHAQESHDSPIPVAQVYTVQAQIPAMVAQASTWSFPPSTVSAVTIAQPSPQVPSSNTALSQSDRRAQRERRRQWLATRNPFGTRQDVEEEDYVSPLTTMYQRAWTRYETAEETRQAERVADSTYPAGPNFHAQLYSSQVQTARQVAERITSIVRNQMLELGINDDSSPDNAIDRQQRPLPLAAEALVASIACRICHEQRVDTLLEPCMHIALCHYCSEIVRQQAMEAQRLARQGVRQWRCPICRKEVNQARRVHLA